MGFLFSVEITISKPLNATNRYLPMAETYSGPTNDKAWYSI